MRQLNSKMIGVLSVLGLLGAHASPSAISVSISAPNTTVHIGQPIPIRVETKNTSNNEVRIVKVVGQGQAELNYQVVVLDAAGRPVPQTTYGKAVTNREILVTSRVVLSLPPTKTSAQTTDLAKMFEITSPGTYTVRVGRTWPETKAGKMVWSNTLTLTITN